MFVLWERGGGGGFPTRRPPAAPDPRAQRIERLDGQRIDAERISHVIGNGDIVIVEFSDFECPFCGQYARETLPTVKRDLVESGMVRYVVLHYPLETIHPHALKASEAVECADRQGHFWEMRERLFSNQAALAPVELIRHAEALGLDSKRFDQCVNGGEAVQRVRADVAEGRRLGVLGTPSFFIGTIRADGGIDLVKRMQGAVPADLLASEVREARALPIKH